ncbi:MAG: hypothetical protein FJ100_10810 [Deltaproteobacteria bacterium]|nr:hypothetical protein [Deltaproteobacteria bacterium]
MKRLSSPWIVAWCAPLALATSCANTGGGGGAAGGGTTDTATGGGSDTKATGADTATGGSTDGGGTKTDGGSTAGEEKNIVDIQKASAACPNPAPQTWGDSKGVTIRNVVVSSPARSEGSAGTLVGLFVQQKGGGQWSGLYVTGKKSAELGQAKPGDVLTLTGDVKDFYCFTQIYSTFTTIESQGKELPVALTVTTADLGEKAGAEKTEPYEGVLVQLHDVVVGDDALGSDGKPHGEIYVGKDKDDKAVRIASSFFGVYLSDKTKGADGKDVFTPKYPKGTKLGTLTGVVEYAFGQYRLVVSKDPEGVVKP